MAVEDIVFGKKRHYFGGIEPSNMESFEVVKDTSTGQMKFKINAALPGDTVINGMTLCTVAGAEIRRKTTDYPADEFDGELIAKITESTSIFDDTADENGTYYYAAFPFTTQEVYNRNPSNRAVINEPEPMVAFTAKSVYDVLTDSIKVVLSAELPEGVAGAKIRKSTVEYPATENDGELFADVTFDGNLNDAGVVVGQTYYYTAFPYTSTGAYNRNVSNRASVVTTKLDESIPEMETFTAQSIYNTTLEQFSINVTASVPDGANGVIIRRSTIGFPETETDGSEFMRITEGGTYTDTNIVLGTTYYYSAFPYSNVGVSRKEENRVSCLSTTIDESLGPMPVFESQSFYDAASNTVSIILDFELPENAIGVVIRKSTVDYPATESAGDLVTTQSQNGSFSDTNVTVNTLYYYSAFPFSTQGYNRNDNNRTECTPVKIDETLGPMQTFTSESVYNTAQDKATVKLNCVLPEGAAGAVIRRATGDYPEHENAGTLVTNITENGEITDDSVTVGTLYYYAAFPYTANGAFNYNNLNRTSCMPSKIDNTLAAMPTFTAKSIFNTLTNTPTVQLTCVLPPNAIGCVIRRGTDAYPATESDGILIQQITGNEVVIDALVSVDTKYYYAAFPYSNLGYSRRTENRAECTPTRIDESLPAMPLFKASSAYDSATETATVELTATLPNGATGCIIRRSTTDYPETESDGTQIADLSASGTFTDIGVVVDMQYFYSAFPYSASGISRKTENRTTVTPKAVQIFGVVWDGTASTRWTRTDEAATFTDPVPYVAGATNYGSPFDEIDPWASMTVEERTGGTMVKMKKFWYELKQVGQGMSIRIATGPMEGFHVSPMHMDRGDGKGERDVAYVGRYHCCSGATGMYKSISGRALLANATRASFRTGIHGLGSNIWQQDWATHFTIWLLYLVEFADWNSQAKIGYGCSDSGGVMAMGYTDSMPYHTGTTKSNRTAYGGTQYRNIEGLWDNVYDWVDGCYYGSGGLYIILNPANFSDSSGGVLAGTVANGYPSAFAVRSGGFPSFTPSAGNGSDNSYSCDGWYFYASAPCLCVGGYCSQSTALGLFYVDCLSASSSDSDIGSRLQELP